MAVGGADRFDVSTVVFDFFGTLVTYEPDRGRIDYPATCDAARSLGFRGDHAAFVTEWQAAWSVLEAAAEESCVEFSMTDAAAAFVARTGLDAGYVDAVALGASFLVEWRQHVRPVDGAAEMLLRLARTRRLGIVSNTHDPEMVPSMLDEMGVAGVLGSVVLSVDHGYRKPHPSIYARCAESLDVSPGDVLFVGDSYEADYDGPRRAGMHAVLIAPGGATDVPREHRIGAVTATERLLCGPR